MNIIVINGTEKLGATYRLKEIFLEPFKEQAEIAEYFLPRDCPAFCAGCVHCVLKGEQTCKDAAYIQKIANSLLEAHLIVMASPVYVFHTTGAMKVLLDHFAYLWMSHRPDPKMFQKRAVIITQCVGAGAKSAERDIRHSLCWWGISKISSFTAALMEDIVWDRLTEKKRAALTRRMKKLSERFSKINYHAPARTSFVTKLKFSFCRVMKKSLYKQDPKGLDGKHWAQQGWLAGARPWKSKRA